MPVAPPRLRVYVDGFNLYHRRLKSNPQYKWLDLEKLAEQLFPDFLLDEVKFFTALIKPGAHEDVHSLVRQQAYLRALATSAKTSVILGRFRRDVQHLPAHPVSIDPDVNLATHLVFDSVRTDVELLVAITNDSDQAGPLAMLAQTFPNRIALVLPSGTGRHNKELSGIDGLRTFTISDEVLERSQFHESINDAHGTVRRPGAWR